MWAIKNWEGSWVTEPEEIKELFYNFYSDLFSASQASQAGTYVWNSWMEDAPNLTNTQLDLLSMPFSMQEIKQTAFSMKGINPRV